MILHHILLQNRPLNSGQTNQRAQRSSHKSVRLYPILTACTQHLQPNIMACIRYHHPIATCIKFPHPTTTVCTQYIHPNTTACTQPSPAKKVWIRLLMLWNSTKRRSIVTGSTVLHVLFPFFFFLLRHRLLQ